MEYVIENEFLNVTVKKENIESYKQNFLCINSTIDTGIRKTQRDIYPVFTSKEKCLEWLKAWVEEVVRNVAT